MTKTIWTLAIILICSFFIFNLQISQPKKNTTLTSNSNINSNIVIGYSNWAGWWPWAIAETEGLFAKHDLKVELRWYDDYSQSLTDLATGFIDGNCQTLKDTIIYADQAIKGETIVLITDSSTGNDKIIVETGINTVEDLKGKTITVEGGENDFLLALSLEKAGLSPKDLNVLNVETGAGVEAFIANQSNAVRAFAPYWFNALKKQGAHEIISSVEFSDLMLNLLVVTENLKENHPEQVQALVDTWFDVVDFLHTNLDRSDEILAQRASTTIQIVRLLKPGTKIYLLKENVDAFSQGKNVSSLSSSTKEAIDFLFNKLRSIEKRPNISRLIDSRFVEAVSSD